MSFSDFLLVTLFWAFVLVWLFALLVWTLGYRYRREQQSFLYYPEEPSDSRHVCEMPAEAGIPYSENVTISTVDGVALRGFLLWPGAVPSPSTSTLDGGQRLGGAGGERQKAVAGELSQSDDGLAREDHSATALSTPVNGRPAFVLIYFHGNAGNVSHRIPVAAAFAERLQCAVLMVDYRGYGRSDNAEVNQEGLERDAEACLNFVLNDRRLPRERVYVMGTSLGGAVAIHLAAKAQNARNVAAVVVENSFTSIRDMTAKFGAEIIPRASPCWPSGALCIFNYFITPLALRIGWNSIDLVGKIKVPMLFLSSQKDELVPPEQMKRLHQMASRASANQIRRFVEFPDGHHNDLVLHTGYFEAIQKFVHEVEQDRLVDVV